MGTILSRMKSWYGRSPPQRISGCNQSADTSQLETTLVLCLGSLLSLSGKEGNGGESCQHPQIRALSHSLEPTPL